MQEYKSDTASDYNSPDHGPMASRGSEGSVGSVSQMTKEKLLAALRKLDLETANPATAKILYFIGNAFQKEDDQDSQNNAIQYYKKALAMYAELEDIPNITLVRTRLGMVYLDAENYGTAQAYFTQALEDVDDESGPFPELAGVHYSIGLLKQRQGHLAAAIPSFQAAVGLYSLLGINNTQLAQTQTQLGITYWKLQNLTNAQDAFTTALTILGRDTQTYEVASLYDYQGLVHLAESDSAAALAAFSRALTIYATLHEDCSEPNLHAAPVQFHLGRAYLALRNLAFAKSAFSQALETYGESIQTSEVAEIHFHLGIISQLETSHPAAISNFNRALTIYKSLDESIYSANILAILKKLGQTYLAQSNTTYAISCFKQALELAQELYAEDHPEILEIQNTLQNITPQTTRIPDNDSPSVTNPIQRPLNVSADETSPLNGHNNPTYEATANGAEESSSEEYCCCPGLLSIFSCFKTRKPSDDTNVSNPSLKEKLTPRSSNL